MGAINFSSQVDVSLPPPTPTEISLLRRKVLSAIKLAGDILLGALGSLKYISRQVMNSPSSLELPQSCQGIF